MISPARPRTAAVPIWPFFLWMLAGAGLALGLLGILTIGIFVLPVAAALAIALARWPRTRNRTAAGLLSGLGLVPLYVAYQNRGGSGTVCVSTATSQSCTQEWSPWPWAGAGLALITASLVAFLILRAREAR
jgi:hypothetical protein